MRKIVTILFSGVLMVSFAACGGNKEGNTESVQQEDATEVMAKPVVEVADAEKALAEYESYVEGYVEIINKMKTGDVSVAEDYSKLSQQKPQYDADMARYDVDFDDAQKKRWEDGAKKLAEALKSLADKK